MPGGAPRPPSGLPFLRLWASPVSGLRAHGPPEHHVGVQGMVVSTYPQIRIWIWMPRFDTVVPRSWAPHPNGEGCPRFAWPRASRSLGRGRPALPGSPRPQHPAAAATCRGTPSLPSPTRSSLLLPLLCHHPGRPRAAGCSGDPQPWRCPLPAHAKPLPAAERPRPGTAG